MASTLTINVKKGATNVSGVTVELSGGPMSIPLRTAATNTQRQCDLQQPAGRQRLPGPRLQVLWDELRRVPVHQQDGQLGHSDHQHHPELGRPPVPLMRRRLLTHDSRPAGLQPHGHADRDGVPGRPHRGLRDADERHHPPRRTRSSSRRRCRQRRDSRWSGSRPTCARPTRASSGSRRSRRSAPSSITFLSLDKAQPFKLRRISYRLTGQTLERRQAIGPDVNPANIPAPGSWLPEVTSVKNTTLFTYQDAAGATTATASAVRSVGLNFTVATVSAPTRTYPYTTDVTLRITPT